MVCTAAYAFVDDFATYWVAHAPGSKALQNKPRREDFVAVCLMMPGNVQRCMHNKYRSAYEKSCDAVLLRLDPGTRAKIDGLFLEFPEQPERQGYPPKGGPSLTEAAPPGLGEGGDLWAPGLRGPG